MSIKLNLIIILLTAISTNNLQGQNTFQDLNNIPTTLEVRAPEFNTEKKYFFKIDSSQNNLIIQELCKSKSNEPHFYQWIYEIPISSLNSGSFKVSKDTYNENELSIVIKANDNTIISYMFQDGEISSISAISGISLGNWVYSDSLFNSLNNTIKDYSSSFPQKEFSNESKKPTGPKYKFIAENVTSLNATIDIDLTIGNGYHFKQISEKLESKIIKNIKSSLKEQEINHQYPIPVIVYINTEGELESIFIGNQPYDKFCQIDLTQFNKLKNENEKVKFLFLLE